MHWAIARVDEPMQTREVRKFLITSFAVEVFTKAMIVNSGLKSKVYAMKMSILEFCPTLQSVDKIQQERVLKHFGRK